jgi:hypothetical protein
MWDALWPPTGGILALNPLACGRATVLGQAAMRALVLLLIDVAVALALFVAGAALHSALE